nr:GH184 muramidase [Aspergillus sp. XZ2668]
MMFIPLVTLCFAAAIPVVRAYPVKADVHCRSGPGTSYSIVKTYSTGTQISVSCQAAGTDVDGDQLWDKTSDGCYVSDYYVSTGSSNYVTSHCPTEYAIKTDVNCRSGPGTNYGIVKTYNQGVMVSLNCQASGTDVDGDSLWDKTSDGCYVSDYYVATGSSSYVTSACSGSSSSGGGGSSSSGNLPSLDSTQSAHARAIIGEAKSQNVGRQGCLAGIATALVESSMLMYANSNVAASLSYPHDAVGSDYDSVGLFQQRVSIYTNLAADMDAAQSAGQFFDEMKKVSGWETMNVGDLCQEVQRSAYPDRYAGEVSTAESICSAGGL